MIIRNALLMLSFSLITISALKAQQSEADLIREYNRITARLKEVQKEGYAVVSFSQKFYNKVGVKEPQLHKSFGQGHKDNSGENTITYSDQKNKAVFIYFLDYEGKVYKAAAHLIAGPTEKSYTKKFLGVLHYLGSEGFKAGSDYFMTRGNVRINIDKHYRSDLGVWELILEAIN